MDDIDTRLMTVRMFKQDINGAIYTNGMNILAKTGLLEYMQKENLNEEQIIQSSKYLIYTFFTTDLKKTLQKIASCKKYIRNVNKNTL